MKNQNLSRINNSEEDFKVLLDQITTLEGQTRVLWLQIYQNALCDRSNASELYNDLRDCVIESDPDGREAAHVMHGHTLAKYLERLHQSNAQLIKLAELVAAAHKDEEINPDELLTQLANERE